MMTGKSAVITGGGSGIGAAVAQALAKSGAKILLVDVAETAGVAMAEQIRSEGGQCEFCKSDVSDETSVVAYVNRAIEYAGRIDVFVNNAGVEGSVHPISEYPVEDFDRVIAVNLRGAFLGLKHVLKLMIAQNSGSIVNMASVAGLRGSLGMCAYVASKHAILGLTKTAAMEAARFGVRVNAVCPGPIDTRMIHALSQMSNPENPSSVAEQMVARNPSGRLGTPEEVANAVLFLASDACPYLNGESLTVDGGRSAA